MQAFRGDGEYFNTLILIPTFKFLGSKYFSARCVAVRSQERDGDGF